MPPSRPPKASGGSSEKERFEVLLEEMRSQFRLVLESLSGLTGRVEAVEKRMERLEHRLERVEQKMELLQSALLGHSTDVQGLRRDVRSLTERFEIHQKEHAT